MKSVFFFFTEYESDAEKYTISTLSNVGRHSKKYLARLSKISMRVHRLEWEDKHVYFDATIIIKTVLIPLKKKKNLKRSQAS